MLLCYIQFWYIVIGNMFSDFKFQQKEGPFEIRKKFFKTQNRITPLLILPVVKVKLIIYKMIIRVEGGVQNEIIIRTGLVDKINLPYSNFYI